MISVLFVYGKLDVPLISSNPSYLIFNSIVPFPTKLDDEFPFHHFCQYCKGDSEFSLSYSKSHREEIIILSPMVYLGGSRIKHVTDENNDFEIFVSVIGIMILIAGISYFYQKSLGVGLMTTGLGLILVWIGGREFVSFTGMNIMVPLGAIMMIVGIVLSLI